MPTVTKLSEYRNRETLELLEALLTRAREGDLTGIVFCASLSNGRHTMGWSGPLKHNPELALKACTNLSERIGEQLPSEKCESDDWHPTLTTDHSRALRYRQGC
jgi:hypothetical protein